MPGSPAEEADRSALSVLVADDTPELRLLLGIILEQDPRFEVVGQAADGLEAVSLAEQLQPRLVLLDLAMPRLDGLEALPRIRSVAPSARVVVLSGYDRERGERRTRDLGAVGYVEKGASPRELLDELYEMATTLAAVEQALAEARSSLAAEVRSAGSARQFVESILEDWGLLQPMELVKLLVSELVTNAVVHAHSEAEVVVRLTPSALRIEVLDSSSELPVARQPAVEDTSGRGIALVQSLSSAWGARRLDSGKVVWFEVPRTSTAL